MRSRTLFATAAAMVATVSLPLLPAPAGAEPNGGSTRSTDEVDAAATWLADQQQPDGGFELAGFPGFETPDAILALAAAGQPGPGWDTVAAEKAVTSTVTEGKDPLDSVDAWVDSVQGNTSASPGSKAQQAAKVIVLVAEPLGLEATDFDPSDDSEAAVDLVGALADGAGEADDYAGLPFGGRVFAAWALAALGDDVPDPLLESIAASQQPNGSFNFGGNPSGTGFDPDLTASVVIALTTAGRDRSDPTVQPAVVSLGLQQRTTGEWATEFDDGNPNSTAMVVLAAATLGAPTGPCWRDAADVRLTGVPFPSPGRAIERRQTGEGRIASPSDAFGENTFATSQAIQALVAAEGSWFYAPTTACPAPTVANSRRLVNAYYLDLVARRSDEGGAGFWVGQLDRGDLTPAQVARRFTITGEYGRVVVDRLTRTYLGRPATPDERDAAAPTVLAGKRYDAAAAILGRDEYFQATGNPATDESWVEAAYQSALGRAADPEGREWALGLLKDGVPRTRVARLLLGSVDGLRLLVSDTYRQLLRRGTENDLGGRDFWVGEIRRGISPERLVLFVAGSREYQRSTQPPPA